eukprot:TRINITY_DN7008_c0_g1_i6.p1 TRINITY_DN7008_c0_g1~~TRINITY_DN7008_c0_g1_i6.p1  ORF type:complete len:359 (-),score=55.35 TRINITY_DN7008_c0_g1_i6:527-1603(-)
MHHCVLPSVFGDFLFFFLMIRRPPRSTLSSSSAASDVYKRQINAEYMGVLRRFIMSDDEKEKINESKEKVNSIKELGNTIVNDPDKSIQVLSIIGQIEGHSVLPPQTKATRYEHIIPQLIDIEQNEQIKGLLIVLNTVGGDVEAGLAIAEMINSMSKPTVSIVIGGGHSIGVPLATSADFSFITPSATMIVHPVRMNGFVIGVPQTFEYFKKMQERINEFIVRTSKTEIKVLENFMKQRDDLLNDVGTMLIGKQAVDCGLIDEVGGVSNSIEKLKELIKTIDKECEREQYLQCFLSIIMRFLFQGYRKNLQPFFIFNVILQKENTYYMQKLNTEVIQSWVERVAKIILEDLNKKIIIK